jgi:malonate-semialdehyde dehydrogenase (acetylating)/methylmalonate-semialdehyde dehydrogenase
MPIITNKEFEEAVQAAKDAFPAWKRTPVPHRQRIMFKFQQLIKENMVSLYFSLQISRLLLSTSS